MAHAIRIRTTIESEDLRIPELENGRWTEIDTFEGDSRVRAEPFEAVELDLARLWRW